MQYMQDGEFYKIARITGPRHNMLALALDTGNSDSNILVEAINAGSSSEVRLRPEDVVQKVIEGIREANEQFGTNYSVRRVQYIPSDTPPVEIYKFLVIKIIERLVNSPDFAGADHSSP